MKYWLCSVCMIRGDGFAKQKCYKSEGNGVIKEYHTLDEINWKEDPVPCNSSDYTPITECELMLEVL